jgi:hypothetical protein
MDAGVDGRGAVGLVRAGGARRAGAGWRAMPGELQGCRWAGVHG